MVVYCLSPLRVNAVLHIGLLLAKRNADIFQFLRKFFYIKSIQQRKKIRGGIVSGGVIKLCILEGVLIRGEGLNKKEAN